LQSSYRTRRKFISKLEEDTGLATPHDEKEAMLHHHSAILGTEPDQGAAIDLQALGVHGTILGISFL